MSHHLVILKKFYLDRILRGQKSVECRLSRTRRPPFGAVRAGDTLWLKLCGGPIVATARARRVEFVHPLSGSKLAALKARDRLQAEQEYFDHHARANYATFVQLCSVRRIKPFRIEKSSRHAWLVLAAPPGRCVPPRRHGSG